MDKKRDSKKRELEGKKGKANKMMLLIKEAIKSYDLRTPPSFIFAQEKLIPYKCAGMVGVWACLHLLLVP